MMTNQINELLTWSEICDKFPDMWVMVGVPASEVGKDKATRRGFVLYYASNEAEFTTFSAKNFNKYYENDTYKKLFTNYTGKFSEQEVTQRIYLFKKIH